MPTGTELDRRVTPGRIALVILLQAGFYLLGAAVVLGLLAIPVWESARGHFEPLSLLAGAAGLWVAWTLLPPLSRWSAPGVLITAQDQPQLFAQIEELGRQAGLRTPDEVYILADANAFIGTRRVWLRRRRTMGLGLPLLELLSVDELRSVIAHEYGHEHRGDLRLGPWIHGTRRAITATLEKMDSDGVGFHLLFRGYGRLYARASQEIGRAQELHADELAAELVGAGPTVEALRKTEQAGELWWSFWHNELLPVLRLGCHAPLMHGFAAYVDSTVGCTVREARREKGREASPYDSHPTFAERALALAEGPHRPASSDGQAPASSLLQKPEALEQRLLRFFLIDPPPSLQPLPWEEVGERVWVPTWLRETELWSGHLGRLPLENLGEATADLDGWARVLRGAGPSTLSAEAQRRRARQVLAVWVATRLHQQGFSAHTLPGEPVCMRRDQVELRPFELLEELSEGRLQAEAWKTRCQELGLS